MRCHSPYSTFTSASRSCWFIVITLATSTVMSRRVEQYTGQYDRHTRGQRDDLGCVVSPRRWPCSGLFLLQLVQCLRDGRNAAVVRLGGIRELVHPVTLHKQGATAESVRLHAHDVLAEDPETYNSCLTVTFNVISHLPQHSKSSRIKLLHCLPQRSVY